MSVPVTRAKDGEFGKPKPLSFVNGTSLCEGVKACPFSWAISDPLLFKSQGF